MDYLRSTTKLSDQKLRNLYRTELLLQINLLLLQEYSSQQVADLVGYAVENINRIKKWYSLPNQNFSVYDLEIPINAELLGEELELTERRTYDIFKFELLKVLNSKLVAGMDIKAAGKEIGVSFASLRLILFLKFMFLSSWCGRTHHAAYRPVHRYERQNSHAEPARDLQGDVLCGIHRKRQELC